MRVLVEYGESGPSGHQIRRRSARGPRDPAELGGRPGGSWTCPRCGCMTFTAAERFGRVVLACFRCPTYLALIP
jgi:hypothetical protein